MEYTFDYSFDGERDDWEVTIEITPGNHDASRGDPLYDAYAEFVSVKPDIELTEQQINEAVEYGFNKCNEDIEAGKEM